MQPLPPRFDSIYINSLPAEQNKHFCMCIQTRLDPRGACRRCTRLTVVTFLDKQLSFVLTVEHAAADTQNNAPGSFSTCRED